MVASVWSPDPLVVPQVNVNATVKTETFTAVAGQRVFSLSTFAYVPGTGSTEVYYNGKSLDYGIDFLEINATQILLTNPCVVGDRVKIKGFVGISGSALVDSQLRADLAGNGGSNIVNFLQRDATIARSVQAKLRESISARDFDLKGDGATDDSANLVNAFTLMTPDLGNFEIVFDTGNFVINTNITVPANVMLRFRKGAYLTIQNGITVTFANSYLAAERHKVFNCVGTGVVVGTMANAIIFPEWWGAIADGLHTNGADFTARAAAAVRNGPALNAAATFAGNTYYTDGNCATISLAQGFYVIDRTFSIPLSVNVIGYGIQSALFLYHPTANAVECINTNNHLLKDFFIAPIAGSIAGVPWNVSTGYGLYMRGVSTPIVDNVWSSGFGNGATGGGTFYFESVIEGRIHGLISDNATGAGFVIRGVGRGTIYFNCVTAGTKYAACFDVSGYDHHFIGCTAKNDVLGTYGFYLNVVENIQLTNCTAYDIMKDAFVLTSTALRCNLSVCNAANPSVLAAGTYYGFNISGSQNKLTGCKVSANAPNYGYGIFFGGAAIDCSSVNHTVVAGTLGSILDAQPIGNNTYHVPKSSTTNAVPLTLISKSLNNNCGCIVKATVMGKQRGTNNVAYYEITAVLTTSAVSTIFMTGPTAVTTVESDAAWNATLVLTSAAANAGVVALQVTGPAAGNPVDWEATFQVISVTG